MIITNSQADNWNPKTWLHRFTILAVSLVITTGTAISPALPAMQKTFANYPSTTVDLIATIQQIPAFIVLLMSAPLAKRFGIKRMISLGILLMGISGVLPAFIPNLWFILATRIVFGIGIGLINSLAITIINILYNGDDQAQMLGNRGSFEQIGLCIVNISVGLLLNISWQASFLAYFFILIILAIFVKVVPPIDDHENQTNKNGQTSKETVNLPVIAAGLLCALMTTGLAIAGVMTPNIIVSNHLGTATEASIIITVFTLISMVMGFLFGTIFKVVRRFVLPLGLIFLAIGTILMNYSTSLLSVIIALVIIGCSYPLAGTYVFSLMDQLAPDNSKALANSILLVGCNVGTALSPITINFLKNISPLSGLQPGIALYGIIMAIVTICIFGFQIVNKAKK
ncbi:MFS transporter [Nicoliella lavandulae]|uniref:MFS transporter n=1 Tax=Nicoliella lavandulae TaxID=3082954 RepID=A0ABU8SLY0_9LACO